MSEERWQVTVRVPMRLPDEQREALFNRVADALLWLQAETAWRLDVERDRHVSTIADRDRLRELWPTNGFGQETEALRHEDQATAYLTLLDCIYDDDPCQWDHNHSCQAHGFPYIPQGEPCPMHVVGEALKAAKEAKAKRVCACPTVEQLAKLEAGFTRPQCGVHPESVVQSTAEPQPWEQLPLFDIQQKEES